MKGVWIAVFIFLVGAAVGAITVIRRSWRSSPRSGHGRGAAQPDAPEASTSGGLASMWSGNNVESWRDIHQFIEDFPDDAYWSRWKPMARHVVDALEARGLSSVFRIGQSMHHVMLSTLDHHGLLEEPRVTLEFHPEEQTVRVAYSYALIYFSEAVTEETVPLDRAVPTTLGYLRRLWAETKPSDPMPDALGGA